MAISSCTDSYDFPALKTISEITDTISPLSEQSLSSPVEDTGGYQSEVISFLAPQSKRYTLQCIKASMLLFKQWKAVWIV